MGYMIRYRLFGYIDSPWSYRNVTNEAQRNYLIQELITWKDYEIQVAAYNDKGVGIFSDSIKIKTKEGGELLNLVNFLKNSLFKIVSS